MRSLAALLLLATACSPAEGSPCSTPSATLCAGGATLLSCEAGAWRAYPCPSCAGDACDWKHAATGAACPQASEGDGWCPLDGRVVSCFWSTSANAGVFIEAACSGCVAGKSLKELGRCATGRCACQ